MQYVSYFKQNGHSIVKSPEMSDCIFVWSCGYRKDVFDNCLQQIHKLEEQFKAQIVVGGCLPDINRSALSASFDGEIVTWRNDIDDMSKVFGSNVDAFKEIIPVFAEDKICEDAAIFRKEHPGVDVQFHDEFIKLVISEGCNHSCTYCSERLAFPQYRSFPVEEIINKCKRHIEGASDFKVVLLADSLGQYGSDIGTDLVSLVEAIVAIDDRITVSLNNINPADFIEDLDRFRHLLKAGKLYHINLPIQSASDRILKGMNRTYSKKGISQIFTMFNKENFERFDTHVIIGFPGEDDKDVDETIDFIIDHKMRYVLASKYMETSEMAAAKLDGHCSMEVVNKRLSRFAQAMKDANIICNSEDGVIMETRLARINIKHGAEIKR